MILRWLVLVFSLAESIACAYPTPFLYAQDTKNRYGSVWSFLWKKIENVKAIFSTVIILSLPLRFVSWWAQKAMFQVTKCYIERENHCKLHAWCNFFSSLQRLNSMDAWKYTCNSQTQSTQGVSNPCSYRIQILQYENMRGSCEFSKYFTRKQVR